MRDGDDRRHLQIDLALAVEPALAVQQLEALGELTAEGALLAIEASAPIFRRERVIVGSGVAKVELGLPRLARQALHELLMLREAPAPGRDEHAPAHFALALEPGERPPVGVEPQPRASSCLARTRSQTPYALSRASSAAVDDVTLPRALVRLPPRACAVGVAGEVRVLHDAAQGAPRLLRVEGAVSREDADLWLVEHLPDLGSHLAERPTLGGVERHIVMSETVPLALIHDDVPPAPRMIGVAAVLRHEARIGSGDDRDAPSAPSLLPFVRDSLPQAAAPIRATAELVLLIAVWVASKRNRKSRQAKRPRTTPFRESGSFGSLPS